jgi:hypothetical protein
MRDFHLSGGSYEIGGRVRQWEDLDEFSPQAIVDALASAES